VTIVTVHGAAHALSWCTVLPPVLPMVLPTVLFAEMTAGGAGRGPLLPVIEPAGGRVLVREVPRSSLGPLILPGAIARPAGWHGGPGRTVTGQVQVRCGFLQRPHTTLVGWWVGWLVGHPLHQGGIRMDLVPAPPLGLAVVPAGGLPLAPGCEAGL